MTLPAVQAMREIARRNRCSENLANLNRAMVAYEMNYGHFPVGTHNPTGPIQNVAEGMHQNWVIALLPELEAENVYETIDLSTSVYADKNKTIQELSLPFLNCPSGPTNFDSRSSYAAVHSSTETPIDESNNGMFFLNQPVASEDVRDGLAYTLFLGEKQDGAAVDLGWFSGTRATLRNTGHPINAAWDLDTLNLDPLTVGGFASSHPEGAQFSDGAGGIRFYSNSTDQELLQQLGSRSDGEIPANWKTPADGSLTTESKPSADGDSQ